MMERTETSARGSNVWAAPVLENLSLDLSAVANATQTATPDAIRAHSKS